MVKARLKPYAVVANNLYALRLRAGLTQIVLAERAKMDLRSLQRIETGTWNMTIDYLARLQKVLGCRWRDLIAGLDVLPPASIQESKPGKAGGKKGAMHRRKTGKVTSKPGPRQGRRAVPTAKRARA